MPGSDGTLHIRIPKKVRQELQRAADREGRTLSAYAVRVLAGQIPSPLAPKQVTK